jgi:starch synthase
MTTSDNLKKPLRVLFLSSEVTPFAKTGGLADVAGSLPDALKRQGAEVSIALPLYRTTREGGFSPRPLFSGLQVPLGSASLKGNVLQVLTREGVPVYLFEREDLFDRPNLYATPDGDYYDNLERFVYFSRAALLFLKQSGSPIDIIHCHDWQTGLVPAYLKTVYRDDPFLASASTLFTIHNIGYQGLFSQEKLALSGLPPQVFQMEGLEYWGQMSLLKAGIVYADALTTVSPSYAREIRRPEFGLGMDGILRKRTKDLHGVLNGVDYSVWSPDKDPEIPYPYNMDSLSGKARNKEALLDEVGFKQGLLDRPLFGMISRLSAQKGCDLVVQVMEDMVGLGAAVVILGSGEEKYQTLLEDASRRNPGSVSLRIGFDESLAHRIMAGADILLIPSLYEPCGLTQMYALKYGTVPLVRATGGLDDTVEPFDPDTKQGNGFKFGIYTPEALMESVGHAIRLYKDKATWQVLMKNGMGLDFSWDRSAKRYLDLYQSLRMKTARAGVI